MAASPIGMADNSPKSPKRQEWFETALASIGDAVITTDKEGGVSFMNPVAESLTGWKLSDAAGKPLTHIFQIVNEETRRPAENPAARVLREGVVVGLANHTALIARDGTERAIDDSAAPIRSPDGQVDGVVLVFRDVTQRRQAERELRLSEERFRLLVEGTRDYAIFMLDPRGYVSSWNVGAMRIKWYQAGEIIGKHFSIFYPPEAIASGWPQKELETAAATGRFEDEGWRLRKDGSKFWANVIITALRDEAGKLIGFSKITRDLTERMEAETRVRQSERRYRRLFETSRDSILLVEPGTGKVVDANPAASELFGRACEKLVDRQLWELGIFKDASANQAFLRRMEERSRSRYDSLTLDRGGAGPIELEFISNAYVTETGTVIQCNFRDISERRQLARAHEEAEASADLHRRKDEFLAMLSHELRNPLASLVNGVHLLRLQEADENAIQKQARSIIERQVGHLTHLIDDLLEVSRISTGRIRLHPEKIDARSIVHRAVEMVRPLVIERQHVLTIDQPPEPVWLYADPTRLEQVLVNLLNNAAKYTDPGGHIVATVQRDVAGAASPGRLTNAGKPQADAEEVVFRVKDTGVGIAPDLLPRIFDLFTQAERSLDRSQGGLGIGLTLVKRLVEMHGGTAQVHSTLGQGSEFIIRLPVGTNLPLPPGEEGTPQASTPHAPGTLQVLVVDDSRDMANSTALLLRASGHDVRVAHSGSEALAIAAAYRPSVVLLDIGLPAVDGYEVARRLRQLPECQTARLIAVTGYGQDSDRILSRQAGFDSHLVKPVNPDQLRAVLASGGMKSKNHISDS
jgi:PAS domain S-box-containing protein